MKVINLLSDIMRELNGDRKIINRSGYHQIEIHETKLDEFNKRFEEAVKEIAPEPAKEEPIVFKPKSREATIRLVDESQAPSSIPHYAPEMSNVERKLNVIQTCIYNNRKINAIKHLRGFTGWGLGETKDIIDDWYNEGKNTAQRALELLESDARRSVNMNDSHERVVEPTEYHNRPISWYNVVDDTHHSTNENEEDEWDEEEFTDDELWNDD